MLHWIVSLSLYKGAGLLVLLIPAIATLGTLIVHHTVPLPILLEQTLAGGFQYAFFAQVAAGVVAFVLVNGGIRYSEVLTDLHREAAALTMLKVTVEPLDPVLRKQMHNRIHAYAESVINLDWPMAARGERSRVADQKLRDIYITTLQISRTDSVTEGRKLLAAEFIRRVIDSRSERINEISQRLTQPAWLAMSAIVLAGVVFLWYFGSTNLTAQAAMAFIVCVTQMGSIYLGVMIYNPFTGVLAISPDMFQPLLQ